MRILAKTLYLGAALALFLCQTAAGQIGPRVGFQVQSYSLSSQIGGNTVTSLAQTDDGYLWVGTPNGLYRFNGDRFVPARELLPVQRLRVQALLARGNTLFVGTAGRGVIRITGESVTRIDVSHGLSNDVVWDIEDGGDTGIWIATSAGVSRLHGETLGTVPELDGIVSQLAFDQTGAIWATYSDGSVRRLNESGVTAPAPPEIRVVSLLSTPDGRFWMGSDRGLFMAQDPDSAFEQVPDLGTSEMSRLTALKNGEIWAATYAGELWQRIDGRWHHRQLSARMPDRRVNVLWGDPLAGLWVGTRGGLAQITGGAIVELGPTFSGPDVWAVAQDTTGNIWMASDGGGIRKIDTKALALAQPHPDLPSNEIWALAPAAGGGFWAGSGDVGAFLIRGDETVRHISDLPVPQVWSLLETLDGKLFIGTDGGGLVRFSAGERKVFDMGNGLPGNRIFALHEDLRRNIWVGTNQGLCRFDGDVPACFDTSDDLPSNAVWAIQAGEENSLWVSTDGGLARVAFDGAIAAVTREPLSSANVFGTQYDDAGDLWALSAEGLHRVRREQIAQLTEVHQTRAPLGRTFGPADGLNQTQTSGASPVMTLDADGGLWLATQGGLALVQTALLRDESTPVALRIEMLEADGEVMSEKKYEPQIRPGLRVLRVAYSAQAYRYQDEVLVQHRLRGLSDEWSAPTRDRELNFSGVDAGNYEFELKLAANSFGLVSEPAMLRFSVSPYWYERGGIRLLILGAVLFLLIALYRVRMRIMVVRHEQNQEMMRRELDAARALAESQSRYQNIFSNVSDLVFAVGEDNAIIEANPAATSLLPGCKPGSPLFDVFPEFHLEHEPHQTWRLSVPAGAGKFRTIDLRYAIGRDNTRLYVGRDVTEELIIQAQSAAAQRLESIGRLTAGVAHDFNNLLTVIHGNAYMLAGQLEDEENGSLAEAVIDAADRAAEITRKLLSIGRRQTTKPQRIDINEHLRGLDVLWQHLLPENIELTMDLHGSLTVEVDTGLLEQIVVNLVVNSRDAIAERGEIHITTRPVELDERFVNEHPGSRTGPHVHLRVSDTGQGMAAETVAQAFEPFFTTKGVSAGTGLGLATVYGAVKQSNGSVYIQSIPSIGSSVDIYLPSIDGPAVPVAPPEEIATTVGTESILVVEDNPQILALSRKILESGGYSVTTARGVAEARQEYEARHFDLVLSDIIMPDGNGVQIMDRLRASGAQTPVLFMSGYSHEHLQAIGPHENELLSKPFSADDLLRSVRRALDRRTTPA